MLHARESCGWRSRTTIAVSEVTVSGSRLRMPWSGALAAALLVCAAVVVGTGPWGTVAVQGSSQVRDNEWPTYGRDLASTRYSPLSQISAVNFNKLEVAWRFKTANLGPRPEFNLEATPLMIDGRLYVTAGSRRVAIALDGATGELLWTHSEDEGERADAAPRQLSGRGLTYWSDGVHQRVFYVTTGYRLVCLDAKTGRLITEFGRGGVVDLKEGDDQIIDLVNGDIGLHAAPIVANDVLIIGAALRDGARPKSRSNAKGFVRGYDVRTGKRLWIFHTIPEAGEFGADTWENDSASYTGNAGSWAQMSADEELGLVYVPVELPTGDYFGGHRPGAGLFGESLVALDVKTGRRRWHYQFVHHGIWDMDIPCAPILATVRVNGRLTKIVAQPTKQGWVYVFDRVTGAPIWPIEERPVERGNVPGEWYSPTQPFVTKPPAFERQGMTEDDLIDFTPELRAKAIEVVSHYRLGPIFTPPIVGAWEGSRGVLMLPSSIGGINWQGGSYDPETQRLYVASATRLFAASLTQPENAATSDMTFIEGSPKRPAANGPQPRGEGGGLTVDGLPIVKPPYESITAYDMNRGEIAWQMPHGDTPDNVKNNPALKGLSIRRTGRPGNIGTLVTKTLLIAGEAGFVKTASGERGAMLRAYDKLTGADAGAVYMPAPQTGSPMTYMVSGRQYVTVSIGGPGYPSELLTFTPGR